MDKFQSSLLKSGNKQKFRRLSAPPKDFMKVTVVSRRPRARPSKIKNPEENNSRWATFKNVLRVFPFC